MVRASNDPPLAQLFRDILGFPPREGVNNSCVVPMLAPDKFDHVVDALLRSIGLRSDGIVEVGTVRGAPKEIVVGPKPQNASTVVLHSVGGRGCDFCQ